MLSDLLEELKKIGLQVAPPYHCYAGHEDVACDFCNGRKLKALNFCLVCLTSYYEQHLQPHFQSPQFKRHKLVEPSEKLQYTCSRHNEDLVAVNGSADITVEDSEKIYTELIRGVEK
ncbi:unnamed protein product [Pleuronectes platessa]|uniref:Uncharacterized protein n=1 Tax=Pleuronectes platessa TaxID=8262 RepID=A0A9N7TU08_PLEPL|nr:unnamed protein product [Pleuronectes platessa]